VSAQLKRSRFAVGGALVVLMLAARGMSGKAQDQPTGTPDPASAVGGQIAFVSDRDGNAEIHVMDADGSDPRRLTNHTASDDMPAWSPDGSQIAFVSYRDGNYEIYVMNADGSDPRRLTNHSAADYTPAWSPDGGRIAFASGRDGNAEIYVANADGSDPRRLTDHSADDWLPDWSPDGRLLAFTSERDGSAQIYVMDASGSDSRRLTAHSADDYGPVWSPDGSRIAFFSDRDGNYEIYVMNADGSEPRRLTNHSADDYAPVWSPDGSRIVFVTFRDGNDEVYMMDADGSDQRNLTKHNAGDYSPDWRPAAASGAPCVVQAERDGVNVRVGPGTRRAIRGALPPNESVPVVGWAADDTGARWWQIHPPGYLAAEADRYWVAQADVTASGDCALVAQAEAPPVIAAPQTAAPTLPPAFAQATPVPGGGPPPVEPGQPTPLPGQPTQPPAACYSLSVGSDPPLAPSPAVLTPSNCPGGYLAGTQVSVQARDWLVLPFRFWTGCGADGSSANPATISMTGSCALTAHYGL
jgi:Tol biopolymer transport system component